MATYSDDGWSDFPVAKNPVVIEQSSGDGVERSPAEEPKHTPAVDIQKKSDRPPTGVNGNTTAGSPQFVQQEPVKVEQSTQEASAPGSHNIPKVNEHVTMPEEHPMGDVAFSKQTQATHHTIENNRDLSLAYLAKLSKLYATFGQNLANLHKEFIEQLGSF